ncbi:MAG: DNA repair protein RadC [Tannerellaceae bacterium]|jgi:DNA repair protein RadC|nr:DNA repair protein RadC [Tannerellaceae bacterium]
MIIKGASALSDAELLAIIIGTGTREETAVQLSQRILHAAGNNLNELGKRSVGELASSFKGIGEAKAITIAAALELGRRRAVCASSRKTAISTSRDVHSLFFHHLCDLPHEELWLAFTNSASVVVGKTQISRGGLAETSVDLRLILQAALHALASGIIMCHNHPSGKKTPSVHDDRLTMRVKEAAELINMKLIDHLIIADNSYYSYADAGRL